MSNGLICLMLVLVVTPLLLKAYTVLPRERFQIIGAIPLGEKFKGSGVWRGANFTYYGLILASSTVVAVVVFFVLLSSLGLDMTLVLGIIGFVVVLSLIGAKLIARLVEKKENTLTVAGGATVGLYAMGGIILLNNWLYHEVVPIIPLFPVMAALAVSYLLGEGFGRLGCISFGCCYGKPIADLGPVSRRLFEPFGVEFHGRTKKIIYASGLSGVKVLPIQAITSFVYVQCGILGIYLFLEGSFAAAFGVCALFGLVWRIGSEQFRADYRGDGRISAYQLMGGVNIGSCILLLLLAPVHGYGQVQLLLGLQALWNPGVILFLQVLWLLFFLYTGLSQVLGATLTFHVRRHHI